MIKINESIRSVHPANQRSSLWKILDFEREVVCGAGKTPRIGVVGVRVVRTVCDLAEPLDKFCTQTGIVPLFIKRRLLTAFLPGPSRVCHIFTLLTRSSMLSGQIG